MATVYVPQVPSRYDSGIKRWVPTVDVSAASKYGDVKVMLPPEASRLHAAPLIAALREKMNDYGSDDCFVALGDPSIIAITACLAHVKARGLLRILKWDRNTADYILVEARV